MEEATPRPREVLVPLVAVVAEGAGPVEAAEAVEGAVAVEDAEFEVWRFCSFRRMRCLPFCGEGESSSGSSR